MGMTTEITSNVQSVDLADFVPESLKSVTDLDTAIPEIAKSDRKMNLIHEAVNRVPTSHRLIHGDARSMPRLAPRSVHLAVTSPPYWTLKKYRETDGQLGHVEDYETFLQELDRVWQQVYSALVPGGRLICVVGDVCLSRRKNNGEHTCVPLHSSIQERCRQMGYSNLAPIIWHKIANASYEVSGNSRFLGKPYEPNGVVKNDIEYLIMMRKPKGYRKPTKAARILSVISDPNHKAWFQQVWYGLNGASTRDHPAPYPLELAERLVCMFSFVGDTVLDPFTGTATTNLAAARWGRNSIGVEIDPEYFAMARDRMEGVDQDLFSRTAVHYEARQ